MKRASLVVLIIVIFGILAFYFRGNLPERRQLGFEENMFNQDIDWGEAESNFHALSIEALRKGEYPGSEVTIEETLTAGSNYQRFIVSYQSEGLKNYALLTVPNGPTPEGGWPAIVFNHGYIPPNQYKTTEKYLAYTNGFSSNGYVLLKPDFRGHGNSEGEAAGAYGSSAYTIDVLNAVSSIKKMKDPSNGRVQLVNPNKIGMWGHSMGGHITLRSMVVSSDIKAGVIWAGVVANYPDLLNNWRRNRPTPSPLASGARRWRQQLIEQFGQPDANPQFWNSISANSYLGDISGPLQLHHGTGDQSVPVEFSRKLAEHMKAAGKEAELYTYQGDDHNLSVSFNTAMQRSVEFFDKYLK